MREPLSRTLRLAPRLSTGTTRAFVQRDYWMTRWRRSRPQGRVFGCSQVKNRFHTTSAKSSQLRTTAFAGEFNRSMQHTDHCVGRRLHRPAVAPFPVQRLLRARGQPAVDQHAQRRKCDPAQVQPCRRSRAGYLRRRLFEIAADPVRQRRADRRHRHRHRQRRPEQPVI